MWCLLGHAAENRSLRAPSEPNWKRVFRQVVKLGSNVEAEIVSEYSAEQIGQQNYRLFLMFRLRSLVPSFSSMVMEQREFHLP